MPGCGLMPFERLRGADGGRRLKPKGLLHGLGSPPTRARTRANHEYFAPVTHGSVMGTVATAACGLLLHTMPLSAKLRLVESSNSYRRAPATWDQEKAGVRGNVWVVLRLAFSRRRKPWRSCGAVDVAPARDRPSPALTAVSAGAALKLAAAGEAKASASAITTISRAMLIPNESSASPGTGLSLDWVIASPQPRLLRDSSRVRRG